MVVNRGMAATENSRVTADMWLNKVMAAIEHTSVMADMGLSKGSVDIAASNDMPGREAMGAKRGMADTEAVAVDMVVGKVDISTCSLNCLLSKTRSGWATILSNRLSSNT